MSSRRHTPEQIINKLRQAEVEIANGATIGQAAKKIGVTDHISGKRSQEQEWIIAPWRSASSGRGWRLAALAAVELSDGSMAACDARGSLPLG
jgi:hypothetical protein